MDKYKTNSEFNKWFSPINLEKLSFSLKQKIVHYNSYRKKLSFEALLKLFLYGTHEEKESLRDLSASLMIKKLQKETHVETISYSQLSRFLIDFDTNVLAEIFNSFCLRSLRKQNQPKETIRLWQNKSTENCSKQMHKSDLSYLIFSIRR